VPEVVASTLLTRVSPTPTLHVPFKHDWFAFGHEQHPSWTDSYLVKVISHVPNHFADETTLVYVLMTWFKMSDILCPDTKTGWAAKRSTRENGLDFFLAIFVWRLSQLAR